MDPIALLYALSTMAQCAAALAALIGFFGLWRLDRLREAQERMERALLQAEAQAARLSPSQVLQDVVKAWAERRAATS